MNAVMPPLVAQTNAPKPGEAPAAKPGGDKAPAKDFSSYLEAESGPKPEGKTQETSGRDRAESTETPDIDETMAEAEGSEESIADMQPTEDKTSDLLSGPDESRLTDRGARSAQEGAPLPTSPGQGPTAQALSDSQSLPAAPFDGADLPQDKGAPVTPATRAFPGSAALQEGTRSGLGLSATSGPPQTNVPTAAAQEALDLGKMATPPRGAADGASAEARLSDQPLRAAPMAPETVTRRDILPAGLQGQSGGLAEARSDNRRAPGLRKGPPDPAQGTAALAGFSGKPVTGATPLLTGGLTGTPPAFQALADPELRNANISAFTDLADVDTLSRVDVQNTPRVSGSGPFTAPDLPRHVAQQLSAAIALSGGKTTEVALNPAELGRVRISLNSAEAGLVVSILAERPETLDLMRRTALQLAAEFADIGYGSVEFNFGQSASDQAGSDERDTQGPPGRTAGPVTTDAPHLSTPASVAPVVTPDRVDIRL